MFTPSDGFLYQISPDLNTVDPMWGIIWQYSTPPEEILNLAPRIFLGNFHIIAKFTAFLCVTPSGGVVVHRAVTDGQAGSVFKAEVP